MFSFIPTASQYLKISTLKPIEIIIDYKAVIFGTAFPKFPSVPTMILPVSLRIKSCKYYSLYENLVYKTASQKQALHLVHAVPDMVQRC